MKVALITGGFPSKDNPSKSIFNFRAAKGLQKYGEVEVFQLRYWKPGRPFISHTNYQGISVTSIALPWLPVQIPILNALNLKLWTIWGPMLLKNLVKDADIIHSIGLENAPVAARVAKLTGKKHVAQAIGSDALIYLPQRESYFNLKSWMKHTSRVICNSDFLKRHINDQYPTIIAETAYRGTDLSRFLVSATNKKNAYKILYLGGFSNRKGSGFGNDLKGGESLKKIWEHFDKKPDWPYTLLLGGPESKSEIQVKWKQQLQNPDRVQLLGSLSPDEIPTLMKEATVIVIPSKSEGLPNVAVEASAAGNLVIASKVGGIPEIVIDGVTGILLPPDDQDAWILTLETISHHFENYMPMIEAAKIHVQDQFDAGKYPLKLMEIYKSVISA